MPKPVPPKGPAHAPWRSGRRTFLRRAAAASALLPLSSSVTGCAGADIRTRAFAQTEGAVLGFVPANDFDDELDAAKFALADADFSWLSPGDSVFVKVSSNSPFSHPSVTAPIAVRAMVATLFERGAGRVVVGDQAGIQFVRHRRGNERVSSSRRVFERNGLLRAIEDAGAEAHFFDEEDFEDGFFEATLAADAMWRKPMMIPRIVRDVDHLVVLPRMSAHVLSGYTMALKSAVGFLREDSRHHLHHDAADFYERYVDINYCNEIGEKMRMAYTYSPKLLLHLGPDQGSIVDADPAIAIVSTSLARHDTVGAALFQFYNRNEPVTGPALPYPLSATMANTTFVNSVVPMDTGLPWEEPDSGLGSFMTPHDFYAGIRADRALLHAYRNEGALPSSLGVRMVGREPEPAIADHLAWYSDGVLALAA